MKEQIGILVIVIPGDLLNKETAFLGELVTPEPLNATIADYVGIHKELLDIDVDQRWV